MYTEEKNVLLKYRVNFKKCNRGFRWNKSSCFQVALCNFLSGHYSFLREGESDQRNSDSKKHSKSGMSGQRILTAANSNHWRATSSQEMRSVYFKSKLYSRLRFRGMSLNYFLFIFWFFYTQKCMIHTDRSKSIGRKISWTVIYLHKKNIDIVYFTTQ